MLADTTPRDLQPAVACTFHAVTHADRDALEAVLAELETGPDTPMFDQLNDPMPVGIVARIMRALKKEVA